MDGKPEAPSPSEGGRAHGVALNLKKPGATRRVDDEDEPCTTDFQPHPLELPRLADLAAAFSPLPKNLDEFAAAFAKASRAPQHAEALYEFLKTYPAADQQRFLTVDLPAMLAIAAAIPTHLPSTPIHRLRCGDKRTVELKREAVAGFVCCSFFCVWPPPPSSCYPTINFLELYQRCLLAPQEQAKLEMFMNYFRRIAITMPTGTIRITRKVNEEPVDWARSTAALSDLIIDEEGVIEDRRNALQVDFANKYIGGGVISGGCVQEEIRFSINPECLASCLLCEVMKSNEAVLIVGTECFSKYAGYARSLRYDGDHVDNTPVYDLIFLVQRSSNVNGIIQTTIVAIDALDLRWIGAKNQYSEEFFLRELNKAYVGFMRGPGEDLPEVATGNWGCGAFQGDKELKSLLQWLAASQAQRKLVYYTFKEASFAAKLKAFVELLQQRKPILSEVYHAAMEYPDAMRKSGVEFFDFMRSKFLGPNAEGSDCTVM